MPEARYKGEFFEEDTVCANLTVLSIIDTIVPLEITTPRKPRTRFKPLRFVSTKCPLPSNSLQFPYGHTAEGLADLAI